MESCGMQFVKYLLFGFNLLFVLSGLVVVIIGAVVLAGIDEFRNFMDSRIVGPPIVLIIAGLIIFIIAFLGCWGALRENSNMLIAYAVLLLIIFIIEFAVGITAAVAKDNFDKVMEVTLNSSMHKYSEVPYQRKVWDKMQTKLKCCGVRDSKSWQKILKDEAIVPSSCCIDPKCDNKTVTISLSTSIYKDGCYNNLHSKVKSGATILAGVAIGIAFIELAGIVFALLLVNAIRKSMTEK